MASDRIEGVWYPPGASQRETAHLHADADGFLFVETSEGQAVNAAVNKVEISDRVAAVPRRLSFPDGSLFETPDNDGVDRLTGAHGKGSGFIAGLEQFRPRLFVFAAVAIALCYAIYRFAVPVLVEVAVAVTPPAVPSVIGKSALASLDQALLSPSELPAEKQAKITKEFEALAAHSPQGAEAYTLNFRKGGSIGPNAFALPDGSLVLTDELVELAANDEAVLGVLGHEIAHVEGKHTLRQLYRAAGVAALIMLIGGDIGSAGEDILVQGSALAAMSYSRNQETASDRRSVELMLAAGRDPLAIIVFFEKLNENYGDMGLPSMLSTHPETEGRMQAVRTYAGELKAKAN